MRTIVDLPEDDVKALDGIAMREDVSRAELVRRAVDMYLNEERLKKSDDSVEKYYGFLQDCPDAFNGLDGVGYQRKMRGEWEERDKKYSTWGFSEPPVEPLRRD